MKARPAFASVLGVTEVTATAPLRHLCPFRDEIDEGTVTITWQTEGQTFELHSLGDWLAGYANQTISHEELTNDIGFQLDSLGGALVVRSVITRWTTGPFAVEVHSR